MVEDKKSDDLLGYSRVLIGDIEECSRCFGTELYRNAVFRLYNDVVDIPNGPPLKTLLSKFYYGEFTDMMNKEYDVWRKKHRFPQDYQITMERDMLLTSHMAILCGFIKDLLMQSGCVKVFYSSKGGK